MKHALVIKLYGDTETSNAIAEGIVRVEAMNDEEIAVLREELARLKAMRDVQRKSDSNRYTAMVEALNLKYPVHKPKPVHKAALSVWALLCMIGATFGRKTVEFVRGPWL